MAKKSAKAYVGMGGWQLGPFQRAFYPARPPKGFRKLEYYSRYFDGVEVNATFYTTELSDRNAFQWLKDVGGNKEFLFSMKLFKGFTHTMDATTADVTRVLRLLEPLAAEERLFGLVAQFPYSFSRTQERQRHLVKIGRAFGDHALFVEVRHGSWNTPDVMAFLREHHLHLVNTDIPPIKRHMPLTHVAWGGVAYFRLMGRNRETWDNPPADESEQVLNRYLYRYTPEELQQIVLPVKSAANKGNNTFVVFHNDPQANSLFNGFQMRRYLQPRALLQAPEPLMARFPELAGLGVVLDSEPGLFR